MAKRLVKWSLDVNTLKMAKALEDPKATAEILAEFDLVLLYPTFADMTDVQKQVVVYGVKQKLMDTGSSDVGDARSKVQSAKDSWDDLLAGKWKGDRVNATGAAEDKRIAGLVKQTMASPVVSFNSLMMKKLAFPETFTAEDEDKLQSFMEEAVKTRRGKKE
jgi:hypothetical protein